MDSYLRIISTKRNRNRIIYGILLILIIGIGISTRKYPNLYPDFIAEYAGDTLWALTAFLSFAVVFKRKSTLSVTIYSLIFAYLIEISQFYHAEWIDIIRNTQIGSLVLGHGFLWSDMICYSVGILIGLFSELFFTKTNPNQIK